ncbi:MAG: hypothetical protein Hyperionvirus19_28 [Hyperionvirus sp.]|uniref:Uncharacterized protein n=1 Tax=Hyperionvirus sp. TaxID=2487770 RepID=A0A3G5AC93_9VIRU|nr:MAG: hypothetical protein Hyperionvirus19_28 [Hyperionvirus sp.]
MKLNYRFYQIPFYVLAEFLDDGELRKLPSMLPYLKKELYKTAKPIVDITIYDKFLYVIRNNLRKNNLVLNNLITQNIQNLRQQDKIWKKIYPDLKWHSFLVLVFSNIISRSKKLILKLLIYKLIIYIQL